MEFEAGDAPITLTGPPETVLKPPKEIAHQVISVVASHVHITGLTIIGLYDLEPSPRVASADGGTGSRSAFGG